MSTLCFEENQKTFKDAMLYCADNLVVMASVDALGDGASALIFLSTLFLRSVLIGTADTMDCLVCVTIPWIVCYRGRWKLILTSSLVANGFILSVL